MFHLRTTPVQAGAPRSGLFFVRGKHGLANSHHGRRLAVFDGRGECCGHPDHNGCGEHQHLRTRCRQGQDEIANRSVVNFTALIQSTPGISMKSQGPGQTEIELCGRQISASLPIKYISK